MADDRPDLPADELVFRRGKLRKRDDPAIDLFREALANLGDVARVKRILLELGRWYDPVSNGAILDLESRRRAVELLEAGRGQEAHRLLEECLRLYTRFDKVEQPQRTTSVTRQEPAKDGPPPSGPSSARREGPVDAGSSPSSPGRA